MALISFLSFPLESQGNGTQRQDFLLLIIGRGLRGPCVKPMLRKETGVGHSSLFFLVVARRLLLLVPSLALCSVPSLHESRVYGTENARDVSYVLHDYRSEACPSITKPLGVNLLTLCHS